MSCGDGVTSRSVECSGNRGKCDVQTKPTSTVSCNLGSCPVWKVGDWGQVRIPLYIYFMQKTFWSELIYCSFSLIRGNAVTRVWKDILGIPDENVTRDARFAKISAGVLPHSGGSRPSDKGAQVSKRVFRPIMSQFGLNIRGAGRPGPRVPLLDPPLIGKESGFQDIDDRSSGCRIFVKRSLNKFLADPELPPLFCFLNVGQTKVTSRSPPTTTTTTKTTT